jgi:carbamoyl-phosphate synthase large subunit
MFYNAKPTGIYQRMHDLEEILESSFPPLLIMEYIPNEEYTVDALSARTITIIPRQRDMIRSGITFEGTVEKNEKMIEYSTKLSEKIGLKYAFGFQYKMDSDNTSKLLESNPRIQGTMVLATFAGANIIYGAVKHALGEEVPEFDVKWGTRIMRYWGGLGISEDKILNNI